MARLCGVRVEVFSLGFGKKLLKWKRGKTLYCVSLFPLGGYVKMFGHEYGKEVKKEDRSAAFLYKKLWQRTAIVLAGPLMNFFLAILIFAGLSFMVGKAKISPVVGDPAPLSEAQLAGLSFGDLLLSLNGTPVKSVEEVKDLIFKNPNAVLNVKVKKSSGEVFRTQLKSVKALTRGRWGFSEQGGVVEGLLFSTPDAVVGLTDPKSPAGRAGLKTFDKILSVNGQRVQHLKQFFHLLSDFSKSHWQITVKRGEETKNIRLAPPAAYKGAPSELGLAGSELFIADLKNKGSAEKAGLKKGDFIFQLKGKPVPTWAFLVKNIKNFDEAKGPLSLKVKRDGQLKSFFLTPEKKTQIIAGKEQSSYMLGIIAHSPHVPLGFAYVEKQKNPFKALLTGVEKTFYWCAVVGVYIKKFITGDISRKTLGGAISIGRAAYDSYSYGLQYFFKIMAILSVQLFLLNILPIPIFDGGHLLFYAIELVTGRPPSIKKIMIAQQAGALFFLFLLVLTTFNDLHNWLFIW